MTNPAADSKIAVIFDMDGVICHTNPYHSIAFQEFFAVRNLQPTEEEFAQHMFGKSNSYIMSHFLQRKIEGDELAALEEEKEALFRKIYQPHISPIAGIVPFINNLHAAGIHIGVATSAPRANLDLILDEVPIKHLFGSIMASEDVSRHKPDPEVYLSSARNLGVLPENCLVFEDSFSGITAGLNAGMQVIGVLTSHTADELPGCTRYINDYLQLTVSDVIDLLR